jgi:cytochrome c oxidase subunit II
MFVIHQERQAHLKESSSMADGVAAAWGLHLFPAWFIDMGKTSIFSRVSTPAGQITGLSLFVLTITGGIFLGVTILLVYAIVKFRAKPGDLSEPPQVFGSTQIELSWTIIPILIIVVLFLGTARVVFAIQDAPKPQSALDLVVVGHQFWWEFRYPTLGVVTANELHVPVSDPKNPRPVYVKLTSADVMHSFWVPRLAGKTDALPNRVNEMWIDPHEPGLYLGQCAQFCGPQHAKMLLRVYVDTPADFQKWVATQRQNQLSGTAAPPPSVVAENLGNPPAGGPAAPQPGPGGTIPPNSPASRGEIATVAQQTSDAISPQEGRRVFEEQACINCHAVSGTVANGRYGPDLTHFGSRDTLGSGVVPNTPQNLLAWIQDPANIKPGVLMPAMHLTDTQNKQLVAYLLSLK